MLSSSAYSALRTSGFLKLPSERTLRYYSNVFESKLGFQDEVDKQLLGEFVPKIYHHRGDLLDCDEMKVKEGLVYNKSDDKVIGFTALGAINDELMKLDEEEHKPVAKQILVFKVRGTMFNLTFPYAHFGTKGITDDHLYPIIWIAIGG